MRVGHADIGKGMGMGMGMGVKAGTRDYAGTLSARGAFACWVA